jgi:hypothetical protein
MNVVRFKLQFEICDLKSEMNIVRLTPCGILRGCPERSLLFYDGFPRATCPPKSRLRDAGGSDPQVKRSSNEVVLQR